MPSFARAGGPGRAGPGGLQFLGRDVMLPSVMAGDPAHDPNALRVEALKNNLGSAWPVFRAWPQSCDQRPARPVSGRICGDVAAGPHYISFKVHLRASVCGACKIGAGRPPGP